MADKLIKPSEVCNDVTARNSGLAQCITVLGNVNNNAIGKYINGTSDTLRGATYDKSRQFISNCYPSLYRGLISAYEAMKNDNNKLNGHLGILDGHNEINVTKYQEELPKKEKEVSDCNSKLSNLRSQLASTPDIAAWVVRLAILSVEGQRDRAQSRVTFIKDVLGKVETFESITANLYNNAENMFTKTESVQRNLEGVTFNAGTGVFNIPSDLYANLKGLDDLAEKLLIEYLKENNLDHLKEELGFTPEELMAVWDLMTDADKEFFLSLDGTPEGYAKAFEINPNNLSDNMTLILATYSSKLIKFDEVGNATPDSCKQIEAFTNAMLASDKMHEIVLEDGTRFYSDKKYRDVYLEKMYAGTAVLMEGSAFTLALMDKGTDEYKKLADQYKAQSAMTNFWLTQNLVIQKLKRHSEIGDVIRPSVTDLTFLNGEAQYKLNHFSPYHGADVSEFVETDLVINPSELRDRWDNAKWKELQAAKDDVVANVVYNIVKGGTVLTLGAINPALAIMGSAMFMAIEAAPGTVSGLDSLVDSQMGKLGIKGGNIVATELAKGIIAWQKASQALDKVGYQIKMGWFGSGGKYKVSGGAIDIYGGLVGVSFAGINHPEVIRNILVWEKEGIAGWASVEKAELDKVIERIENRDNKYPPEVIEDCKKLMYGGYDILGEVDMGRFLDAVEAINDEDFSVQDSWKTHLQGESQ